MGFWDEYNDELSKLKKKKANSSDTSFSSNPVSFFEEFESELKRLETERPSSTVGTLSVSPSTHASVSTPIKEDKKEYKKKEKKEKKEERTWFQSGRFADGYQFGDITKTGLGTVVDLVGDVVQGVVGIVEPVIDTGAYVVGNGINTWENILTGGKADTFSKIGSARNNFNRSANGGIPSGEIAPVKTFEERIRDFIEGDLIDEEASSKVVTDFLNHILGTDHEKDSFLGEKVDSVIQSGGQLLGTVGLQALGVPWWVTTGLTSFGGETENALQDDATMGEAGLSALVTAGAEILTEKISGGIKFGGKTLDSAFTKKLATGISRKTVRTLAKLGLDLTGEGAEEVLSGTLSAIGKKITYAEDKELTELFSLEDVFESFVGGFFLSFIGGATNIVKSNKAGVDSVTGLTANEEAVVQKIYDERVKEAEQNGKLSSKDKSKIYDEIINELEKGGIDVDTIESVLGGDAYTAYRDTINSEEALKTEFEDLRKMKSGDMTDIDNERLAELKGMNLDDTSKRDGLREELNKALTGKVDGRLVESYNERARKGVAFEADLTKYDAKQQEVIKRAVESKILNNTRRTHEFVDMVAKISADKGVLFDFTNNEKLKQSGFAIDGKTINGFVTKDGVTLNIQSAKSLNSVVGHEITHVLEGTELYNELQGIITEYAKSKNDYQGRYDRLAKLYEGVEGADVNAELTADLVGDYLFTDPDFINNLSTEHRNVFEKIYDEIKYLYKVATAGSKEARQMEKVKKVFDKAYRENVKGQTDTKYSISDSDGRQLTKEQQEYFKDSKVVDENGNLKVMYHGTSKGGHTVFDPWGASNYGLFGTGVYFTDNKTVAESYTNKGKGNNKQVYESYLNITNPMDMEAKANPAEWAKAFPDASFPESGTNEQFYRAMEEYFEGEMLSKWEAAENALDAIIGMGYDGITHIGGGRFNKSDSTRHRVYIAFNQEQIKNIDNVSPTSDPDIRYSISDSEGNNLTAEQQEYFKDSKMRDADGNLKVMYHGSQDAGFHIFDSRYSDDGASLFFVDSNSVASSYSGTSETYTANTFKTAEDFNKFFAEIGADEYTATEENGTFRLLEDGDEIATSETADGLYEEFRDWTGKGYGEVNYKVYLNLVNPLEVDAQGKDWNGLPSVGEAKYDYIKVLEVGEGTVKIEYSMTGESAPVVEDVDLFQKFDYGLAETLSNMAPGESLNGAEANPSTTRDYAKYAKENGYDGVIFRNIVDIGGYGGVNQQSTVAIAFDSNQVKSVGNAQPTANPDIRYSLSPVEAVQPHSDAWHRTLTTDEAKAMFPKLWDVTADESEVRNPTQIGSTVNSYRKVYDYLKAEGFNGTILDASSGLGYGTRAGIEEYGFSVDDIEPFPDKSYEPKYKDYSTLDKKYDAIISNAVLNVLPQDQRDALVVKMGELLNDGGRIFINVRGKDVDSLANTKENINVSPMEWLVDRTGSYQKGFTKRELVAYLRDALGDGFTVKPTNMFGAVSAIVTKDSGVKYSLSEDSEGRALSPAVQKRFANSKVVDENGNLKAVYHGTAAGEFSVFDKAKGSNEGDFGSGFYFTDNAGDVEANYEGGGPDFENKVALLAERIEQEQDIDYDVAEKIARAELYKGSHKFEVYLNIENPAVVGDTVLFSEDKYLGEYDEADYDSYEDYLADVEQLVNDDIDNVVWEVEKNLDLYSVDGLSQVLFDAYYDGGIQIEALKDMVNQLYLEDANGNYVGNEVVRQIIESLGYDGIIDPTVSTKFKNMGIEKGTTHYIVFKPNQIKDVGNVNPTDNPDIHKSLSKEGEQFAPIGKYNVYGKDIALETAEQAPVQSQAQEVTETADIAPMVDERNEFARLDKLQAERDALEQEMIRLIQEVDDGLISAEEYLAKYEQSVLRFEKVDAEYKQLADKLYPIEQAEEAYQNERLSTLDEADMPPEAEAPYPGEKTTYGDPFENRDYSEVGSQKVKPYMAEHPEVIPYFKDAALGMLDDLNNSVRGERWVNHDLYYDSGGEKGFFGTKRSTTTDIASLLDSGKTYDEIRAALESIVNYDGGKLNALAKRIEFDLNRRLIDGYKTTYGEHIPAEQGYIRLIQEMQANDYSTETFNRFMENADMYAPVGTTEEVVEKNTTTDAPVAEKYEAIRPQKPKSEPKMVRVDNTAAEQKVAEVYDSEPVTQKKKNSALMKARAFFVDKGSVFEDVSLKTKNRELMGKWNFTLGSTARANRLIGNGTNGVKSLNDITEEVSKTGHTKQFYEYLYHQHNVDRMTLAERFEDTPNKPVFGDSVTAQASKNAVKQYEAKYPMFKQFAKDVYSYNRYLRNMLVDNGVISQETAILWEKMYPHYVPIRRVGDTGLNINVPLDTGKTGVNAPVKKATGGNSDIMPLFDTMAQRTMQTFRAVARNNFGVELKNSLGSTITSDATSLDELIDSIDNHDGLLQEGKNGNSPTFTVFENGEKVTFEITQDMYDALKPTSDGLSYTNKLLNTASNLHRGVLTEYNPVFMLTNGIKDVQDVLINSQHPLRTYAKIPEAYAQLARKGQWYKEYMEAGGEQNSYFDNDTGTIKTDNKGIAKLLDIPPISTIGKLNNFIEMAPRLAEYIASREAGQSVEVSFLDAARVTTNFAAGGDGTKFLNRNGATFLNASVQGANQFVRNFREANAAGLKGWANLATKFALAGIPALILNNLVWDDDEEYEELSDYVKQNYYVVWKTEDGKFIRIPKGRTMAVIQGAFEQISNAVTGDDEVDLQRFLELVVSNLAPNNPIENNILAPIIQVANNETWYGEDLVPTRLQDLPAGEQFDESTDAFSKFLGEKLDISPIKINYLLDQYTGGIGDTILPMLTPEAESGDNSPLGNFLAPLKSKFTTDGVMNNQNVSDFYDKADELTTNAKSSKATDEDILKSRYMNSINAELSDLYAKKREIQSSALPDDVKYTQVRDVQKQIVDITRASLDAYESVRIDGDYATVGDLQFRLNKDGEWEKISAAQQKKQDAAMSQLGISASDYWSNKEEYDFATDYADKYTFLKENNVSYKEFTASKESREAYNWAFENPDKYKVSKYISEDYMAYRGYMDNINDFDAKDANGETVSGLKKERVKEYIFNLDIDYGQQLLLFKSQYPKDDTYNYELIDYLNDREDIDYWEMVDICKSLGFEISPDGSTISWD